MLSYSLHDSSASYVEILIHWMSFETYFAVLIKHNFSPDFERNCNMLHWSTFKALYTHWHVRMYMLYILYWSELRNPVGWVMKRWARIRKSNSQSASNCFFTVCSFYLPWKYLTQTASVRKFCPVMWKGSALSELYFCLYILTNTKGNQYIDSANSKGRIGQYFHSE